MNYIVVRFFRDNALKMLTFVTLLAFATSCLDDSETSVTEPLGYVSIYHAAPDAPSLDVILNNSTINSEPFDYTDHSGGYLNFYTGDHNLKFVSASAQTILVESTITVEDGKAYSVFVTDTLPTLEMLVVKDSSAIPASGMAMIRFVHLSPDAPDMVVAGQDGSSMFGGTSFKQATAFKEVDAKSYSFNFKAAATDEVLFSSDNISIEAGGYYTMIIRGFATPPDGNTNVLSVEIL